ncbi:hypothetical protein N9284_02785, partial [Halieaceae bacterium]|nr:hypothetical protein [Halieaceae bacterium]
MNYVSIQIPSSLYCNLYKAYGEHTTQEIIEALNSLQAMPLEALGKKSRRPRKGTITGKVWEIADQIRSATGNAEREEVIHACLAEN